MSKTLVFSWTVWNFQYFMIIHSPLYCMCNVFVSLLDRMIWDSSILWVLSTYGTTVCVCVCVAGHQPAECVQIMRWWISNLGQGPLRSIKSVANFYVFVYLTRPSLSSRFLISFLGGAAPTGPDTPTTDVSPHRIIRPPGRHLSLSQNTDASRHDPTPCCPCSPPPNLPCYRHTCRIPVTTITLPLPKSLPPWPSAGSLLPSASTMAPGVSPLLRTLYLMHTHQK